MALTRKLLKGMGLTDEQVDTIIEAHTETTDGLKEQVKNYKADADRLKEVQKELDTLKAGGSDDYKAKYEAEKEAFAKYKADASAKEEAAQWESLYRARLDAANVDKARQDAILRVADRAKYPVKDGKFADEATVDAAIKEEWGAFIATTTTNGAKVQTPPSNTGGKMTREEIMGMTDRKARIEAIARNRDVFEGGNT